MSELLANTMATATEQKRELRTLRQEVRDLKYERDTLLEREQSLRCPQCDQLRLELGAMRGERDKLRFGLAGLLLCVDASEGVKDHVRRALQEAEG